MFVPFSKPSSCPILIFFVFYFLHLPCALSQPDLKFCDNLFHCGNITAGYPFWGEARPEPCGHPSLGLHCSPNSNKTYFIFSGQMYSVFYIDNSTNTIGLTRQEFLGGSFCNSTLTGTTLTPELFQLSSEYTTLFVYYLCQPLLTNPANFKCPSIGVASLHRSNENHEKCSASFNIIVPSSYVPERETLNLTRLVSVLHKGFEVKLRIDGRPCQECESKGGICGYDLGTTVCCNRSSLSEIKCNRMISSGNFSKRKNHAGLSKTVKIGIGVACGFLGSVATGLLLFMAFSSSFRKAKTSHHSRYQNLRTLVQLKQYSYAEVKKITKSFSQTVGKGGFGTVYGGNLWDGRKVAVKIMKDFKSNGEDFINEVASMSQTSHVNIVSLLGFCYEGSKRAIVYEFLENGSLDHFISKKNSLSLDMSTLYGIALGVARGVEYLHHGCKTRIVHFDIKPQNVLLDENLCPKVSDFGLAKLCEKRESILSFLDTRGTIGYIAPEVFSRMYGRVSHKSDVYSYGMLVLEMIGARNKETKENVASNSSSNYFPDWIYKDLENGEHTRVIGDDTSDGTKEEKEIAKKMILVGLWCIQPCPSNRPPMNRVVEMMEGSLDAIEVPPKPSMQISRTSLPNSSCLSAVDSNNFEELI